jgi:predicted nucleic acid-binding protein
VKKHDGIGLKIHDIEIVSIAISHEITSIATINKKDFDYITGIDVHEL